MFRKFLKYLLIGLSSMVLLAGAQQGLFNKPLATQATGCDPNGEVDLNTWALIEDYECEAGHPGFEAHKWACFPDDSGVPAAVKYTDARPTDRCGVDPSAVAPVTPVAGDTASQSQWECERALAKGQNICNDNITFCEATGWQDNQVVSAVLKSKEQGVCDPSNGERDSRGCIFQFLNVRGFNYPNNPQPASLFGAASACPAETSPQQPAQGGGQVQEQQQQQQVQQANAQPQPQQGFVCDNSGFSDGQGRWRAVTFSADKSLPTCEMNNSSTFGGCKDGGASAGNICETKTQAACRPSGGCSVSTPSACGQIATGVDNCGNACTRQSAVCQPVFNNNPVNTNTNTNTNTITVQNPTPQVITTQAAPVVFGNVGVGGTAYTTYTQPIQYTTLPKTGLPTLVWSALAFIPVGFRLRTFQKIKKALENHPSFIWEDRQFKV